MMETFGATVHRSPVGPHRVRPRDPRRRPGPPRLARHRDLRGGRGGGRSDPDTRYALGSVLNHVLLHQTIIGEEALLQFAQGRRDARPPRRLHRRRLELRRAGVPVPAREAGRADEPDDPRVEPASCPSLTRGEYAYDFGDTAGMTPLLKMHTLGHDFIPDPIHAGGLRYHGMSPLLSHIYELGPDRGDRDRRRPSASRPRVQFARTEGIVPAPEPTHALAACIREALALQGDRRGEGHPHRAVRPRALRPGRLRRVPRRPDGRRGRHRRAVRAAPWTTCRRCRPGPDPAPAEPWRHDPVGLT